MPGKHERGAGGERRPVVAVDQPDAHAPAAGDAEARLREEVQALAGERPPAEVAALAALQQQPPAGVARRHADGDAGARRAHVHHAAVDEQAPGLALRRRW